MNYKNYRINACVDWIGLEVSFVTPTNFMRVQRVLHEVMGLPQDKNIYVKSLEKNAGGAASKFSFRIQDPKCWSYVIYLLEELNARHPFSNMAKVVGIEIALDGYSRIKGSRKDLINLATHFAIGLEEPASNNRRFSGLKGTVSGVYNQEQIRRMLDTGRPLVIGNNSTDDWSQRIYVKSKDNGGRDNLDVSEHRARIENTFINSGLPVQLYDEWASFKFESLSKKFSFRKPLQLENPLMQFIMNATTQIGERRKRNLRKNGKIVGVRLYSQNTQADTKLNRRAYDALRDLTRRWAA